MRRGMIGQRIRRTYMDHIQISRAPQHGEWLWFGLHGLAFDTFPSYTFSIAMNSAITKVNVQLTNLADRLSSG